MKRSLLCLFLLIIVGIVKAQGPTPKVIPCTEPYIYTHPITPGAYSIQRLYTNYTCINFDEPTPTGILIKEGRTDVVAGKAVWIGPNTHIGDFSSAPLVDMPTGPDLPAQFHAYIGQNDFDVMWYEPNSSPGIVEKYEKLELGIRLPDSIQVKVNNYINNTGINEINPFNPDKISVEADFYFLGPQYNQVASLPVAKRVYGFYYKDFHRYTNNNDNMGDDGWINDTTSFNFRIRYAPPTVGNWSVKIKIVTPGHTYTVLPVGFKCIESDNPGYVKVGSSNTFLSLGDQDFYPVGVNLAWPRCEEKGFPNCDWVDGYKSEQIAPAWSFKRFEELMTELKNSGANYFRLIITPWTYDVEFEELGNYSYRMRNAWELDKTIELAEQLGLKIQLCLTVHYNFEIPSYYGMKNWDWVTNSCPVGDDGYAYAEELDISVNEFFSQSEAREFYKKRLRYILSRVNHSSAISAYELTSEINNFGNITAYAAPGPDGHCGPTNNVLSTPYHSDGSFTRKGYLWLIEMANYIKNELNHTEHLMSTCYTGDPFNPPGPLNGVTRYSPYYLGDSSMLSSLFDIGSFNFYQTHINQYKNSMETASDLVWDAYPGTPAPAIHKPLIHSEIGTPIIDGCGFDTEWKKTVYITPFTGLAGAFNWHHNLTPSIWTHFGNIKRFLDIVLPYNNISDNTWKPYHNFIETTGGSEPQVEVFSLVNDYSSNSDRAFGVVVNRTYNGWSVYNSRPGEATMACELFYDTINDNEIVIPASLSTLTSISDVDGGHKLKIHDMETGDYDIKWYNPFTGNILQSNGEHVYITNHALELDFPDLDINEGTPDFLPFVYFTAYKDETKSIIIPAHTDSLVYEGNIETLKPFTCSVYPNPLNYLEPLNINCNQVVKCVSLYSNSGVMVRTYNQVNNKIELPYLIRGVYQLKITLEDESIQTYKLIVLY